jgi:thioredoxin-like negative regulator of GroEL
MKGRALVLKVDTDRFPQLAAEFGVQGIPNFVVLKSGLLIFQQPGVVPAATMKEWLIKAGAPAAGTEAAATSESRDPRRRPSGSSVRRT